MKKKWSEAAAAVLNTGKRFGFCTVWLASIQVLSCMICYGALYLFWKNDTEWFVYTAGLLLPVLWGIGGYWIPVQFRLRSRGQSWIFWLVWTVLPALLCVWADLGGPDILWVTLYPQLMARLAWFYSLFEGIQEDIVTGNLQPLAGAGAHLLMMLGFAFGMWLSGKKKHKNA